MTDPSDPGKDHYDDAGDGQCCAIKLSDDEALEYFKIESVADQHAERTGHEVVERRLCTDGGADPTGIEREEVSVSADDGDAVIGVRGAEIRLTVRTDGRERSIELDHHGEGPYWLIVGEDEDGNEGIVGEMEPVFDPDEDGDRDE